MKNERLIGIKGLVDKKDGFEIVVVSKLPACEVGGDYFELRKPRTAAQLISPEKLIQKGVCEPLPGFDKILDPFNINGNIK
jgi:hypothetical protein